MPKSKLSTTVTNASGVATVDANTDYGAVTSGLATAPVGSNIARPGGNHVRWAGAGSSSSEVFHAF